jgi:hypothetical protein
MLHNPPRCHFHITRLRASARAGSHMSISYHRDGGFLSSANGCEETLAMIAIANV